MKTLKKRAKAELNEIWNDSDESRVRSFVDSLIRESQEEMKTRCIEALPKEEHLMGVLGDPDYVHGVGFNDAIREARTALSALTIE